MATLLRHARIVNLVRVSLNGHQGSSYPKAAQSAWKSGRKPPLHVLRPIANLISYIQSPDGIESTSFAFIGSTKSGRRAEVDERDFISSITVRYRLLLNRKNHSRYTPML